ncbi:MAG: carboxypeptidase-like regulatory domain-containing protein [Acidobacteriota bacterium]|nr:carboxypeptidase-like regulatory domain-containing protein [Acidobacteriota bacterium]
MKSNTNGRNLLCRRMIGVLAVLLLLSLTAIAQETRGLVSGQVTDPNGAAIAGATIKIISLATGSPITATTNSDGNYSAPYLLPGMYSITVEAQGFKKLVRQNLEVQVGDRLALNLQLEAGAVTESVTISSDSTPLLDTTTASSGQVIDRRRISELPLAEGNPMTLVRLAPTTVITGVFTAMSALSTSGPSDFTVEGTPQGGNEFTLDGSPNTADRGGQAGALRVGMQPPPDAVQEFKVVNTSFDAQQGHTAGASIDVSVRSGGSKFSGTLYEFVRNDVLGANDFFGNRASARGFDENGKARREARRFNRFGGTLGGPVWLPRFGIGGSQVKKFDQTFFFVSYEEIRTGLPLTETLTVPTQAFRNGDFSSLATGQLVYDPATARQVGARVVRDPLSCNSRANVICSNRISPIAQKYLSFLPLPNLPGVENNFIGSTSERNVYRVLLTRFDQNWSEKHRSFFRFSRSHRDEDDENTTGVNNGVRINGRSGSRGNLGGVFDHVWTKSGNTILNIRAGYTRFRQTRDQMAEQDITPAALGFSPATLAVFGDRQGIPRFNVGGITSPVEQTGLVTVPRTTSIQPTMTRIFGSHSTRFGYDFRVYQENRSPVEFKLGELQFNNNFTRINDQNPAIPVDQNRAQSIASLLLGIPTGGSVPLTPPSSYQSLYQGLFFQDDWKVSRKLTLNLGLRYELEGATTERFNRNLRGFDLTSASPVEAAAKAAYAANPIPEIPAANFNVKGGLLFTGDSRRGFYDADTNNFQPRVGFAYQINEKTVIRGGLAMYTVPYPLEAINATGFASSTPIDPSPDLGLTFTASLANPYPNGRIAPTGSSRGLATFLGQSINVVPTNLRNGQSAKLELNLQRELPGRWLAEISYVGNRGYDLTTSVDLNPVPRQFMSTSPVRDQAQINFLTANVTNPFRNIEAFRGTTFFTATTLQRQQLLRPFPQFTGVTSRRYDGASDYQSMQVRLERRFANGYTLLGTYAFSKGLEQLTLLNPTDGAYEKRLTAADSPHRFNLSGIYELPFGRGRKFGSSWNGVTEALLGGFQVQGLWLYQSGRPIDLGNIYYNGDIRALELEVASNTIGAIGTSNVTDNVFKTSLTGLGFYFQDAAVQTNGALDFTKQRNDARINLGSNIRTMPSRVANLRGQPINLVDLSMIKNFAFTERIKLQLRIESLNAFNHWHFNNPDLNPRNTTFGRVNNSSQVHLPREYQIGLKLMF